MKKTSKPILFFGTEDFSAHALSGLIKAGYDIRAVITKPDSKKGRGQKVVAPIVKTLAQSHGICVLQPDKLTTIADDIRALQPIAGVLVSYGKIIPQSIIDLFTPGIINVHPSLLPKYRGPSPIESAIFNGDETTGVTIMQLSAKMDAGPVYSQVKVPLDGTETRIELYKKLADIGTDELLRVIPDIVTEKLKPTIQTEKQASYCQLLRKNDALLDPQTMTAPEAERHVRAYLGFPRSKAAISGQQLIVTKAQLVDQSKTPLDVTFYDGSVLSISEVIAPSGKTLCAEAYLRGYAA